MNGLPRDDSWRVIILLANGDRRGIYISGDDPAEISRKALTMKIGKFPVVEVTRLYPVARPLIKAVSNF